MHVLSMSALLSSLSLVGPSGHLFLQLSQQMGHVSACTADNVSDELDQVVGLYVRHESEERHTMRAHQNFLEVPGNVCGRKRFPERLRARVDCVCRSGASFLTKTNTRGKTVDMNTQH